MEGFALSTIAQCVVTEVIKAAINCTRAAVKCKSECRILEQELVIIMPDVEKIERRIAALREANPYDAHEDLQMVDAWLVRLKNAIASAKIDVYRCNSGKFSLDQHKLSVKLTSQYNTITNLAQQRQSLFLHLRNLIPVPAQVPAQVLSQAPSQAPSQGTLHPPQDWFESPGASVLRRMFDERNDALRREELHRQSMSPSPSLHNGWGYGYGGYESSSHGGYRSEVDSSGHGGYRSEVDSSGHGGYRSETDSSGHGGDSPGVHLFRQVTQQRDVVVQREQQHWQAEAERQVLRRHTLTGALASAYGHDPEPAYDKWKY